MNRFFIIFSLITVFIFYLNLTSCDEEDCFNKDEYSGIIDSVYNLGKCFYFMQDTVYVIENFIDFQNLRYNLDSTFYADNSAECDTAILINPDFSVQTLLGAYAEGHGCTASFGRNVEKDEANKKYVYTVEVTECGNCSEVKYSMNWVLVPKLPEDYQVEFIIK